MNMDDRKPFVFMAAFGKFRLEQKLPFTIGWEIRFGAPSKCLFTANVDPRLTLKPLPIGYYTTCAAFPRWFLPRGIIGM